MKKRHTFALTVTLALSLAPSCGIIGPCNPPQLTSGCIAKSGNQTATTAPVTADMQVSFGGNVVVTSSQGASAPTPSASPSPAFGSASPSPAPSAVPTPSPSPTPAPPRPTALLFATGSSAKPTRVTLDSAGNFNASLAPGTYSVSAEVTATDGSTRTIQDPAATLTFTSGERFRLQVTVSGSPGQEKLVVTKQPTT